MRLFIIFAVLFAIRFIFLPFDIDGKFDFLYHILMGVFIGITATIVNRWFLKRDLKKQK